MATRTSRWPPLLLLAGFVSVSSAYASGQVFVVGEKSATSSISTSFTPTDVPLPSQRISERGRRELVRNLESEQGFAHLALPMGPGLVLRANGPLSPGPEQYKRMIYEKGQSAGPGDRVQITTVVVKDDRIIFDFNGGPYAKHRFLSHIQLNDNNVVAANPSDQATGSRLTLVFEGGLPEISAPEVKALMQPVVDFGAKSGEQAYAETLPTPIKNAIEEHDVLVGMTHRMVLAALGPPEQKIRDQPSADAGGTHYEEWIYGHIPQTVKFVRFVGDRVTLVEIAALGKPLDIHDKNEMGDYAPPIPTREIAMGDTKPSDGSSAAAPPPTLRQAGEAVEDIPGAGGKVQYPAQRIPATPGSSDPSDISNTPGPSNDPNSTSSTTGPYNPNGTNGPSNQNGPYSPNGSKTPGVHPTMPSPSQPLR
jgi:hypothetical protein